MRSFLCNNLHRFETFVDIGLFLNKVIGVSGARVEFISFGVVDCVGLRFLMGVWLFLIEKGAICCASIEGLLIRVKLHVFNEDIILLDSLWTKRFGVFWRCIKGNLFILILDPGHYLFPHLWLLSWVMFAIWWVDIIIGSIFLCFWVTVYKLSGGGFFQVLMGCLINSDWYDVISVCGIWI